MAVFDITAPDGKKYEIEGADANGAMAALQKHLGANTPAEKPLDKYQQAAVEERDKLKSAGVDTGAGLVRQGIQGATFGGADEVMAALSTPLEMIKRGTFDPREGYNYAKARENLIMDDSKKQNGMLGTGAEIAGGVLSGTGLARGGITLAKEGMGLGARTAAGLAEGLGYGATTGALDGGDSFEERAKGAGKGALVGALTGGALPAIGAVGGAIASPVVSAVRARFNPGGVAESQLARALSESGQTASQVENAVKQAALEGQGSFTVADALGNSGQRMLSTVTRAPGAGRQEGIEFLNNRQAGQGDRVSGALDEALGAGSTARKTADELTQFARTESAPFYQAALEKKPVWTERMQQFFDDPVTKRGLKEGVEVQRLESLAEGKKFNPHDYAITHFDEAGDPVISAVPNMRTINLIKKGWDNQLEGYRDSTTGRLMLDEKGRALDNVRRSFLKEVDSVNPDYAKARELYAGPAQARDAVNMGGKAATRGRAPDNVSQFEKMAEPNKQGYRIGYADKLSEKIERGADGVNAVRPLTSDKARQELLAMSLHQGPLQPGQVDPLTRRLNRESTMFETRRQATGGSGTHENGQDAAAMAVDPSVISALLHGQPIAAATHALRNVTNGLTGYTPAVREQLGKLLLSHGENAQIAHIIDRVGSDASKRHALVTALRGGLLAGTGEGMVSQRK